MEKSVYDSDGYKSVLQQKEQELNVVRQGFVLPPDDLGSIEFQSADSTIRASLTGRAGPKTFSGHTYFFGNVENSNSTWILTQLVLRISDKKIPDAAQTYTVGVYAPPGKSTRFCTSIDNVPEEFAWNIQEANGFQSLSLVRDSTGG